MRHVNCVAICAAALLQFTAFAPRNSRQHRRSAPSFDPYYAARQALKEAAAQSDLTGARSATQPSPPLGAAEERAVAPATGSATSTSNAARPAAAASAIARPIVYDPYYATRQPVRRDRAPDRYQTRAAAYQEGETEDAHTHAASESYESGSPYDSYESSGSYGDGCGVGPSPYCSSCLLKEIQSDRCLWANVEYLSFWVKGNRLPPLVTTSPPGTPQTDAGVLGEPGTSVLFGNERINDGQRNGGRITAGGWWVGDVIGIEGNYWTLGRETTNFRAVSDFSTGLASTDPILARPFVNAALGFTQDSLVVAFPGFIPPVGLPQNVSGRINVSETSELQSAGLGLRHLLGIDLVRDHRLFLVGGYRFFRMDEDLTIANTIEPMAADVLPGTFISVSDLFATRNQFHGGDVGLMSDLRRGVFVLQTTAKVAMGNMRETVIIDGGTTIFDGINTTFAQSGLLAQPSIIGFHHQDQFVVIPELDIKLGLQITPAIRATAGYNFMYVTRVVRPGNEVKLPIDPVTGVRPATPLRPTDLWVQGITGGLEMRF